MHNRLGYGYGYDSASAINFLTLMKLVSAMILLSFRGKFRYGWGPGDPPSNPGAVITNCPYKSVQGQE